MIPALALLGIAAFLWLLARRLQQRSGLPRARVISEDVGLGQRPARALRSERYRLSGRPDYVLRLSGHSVPVEVKPTRRASRPYASDLMQLAAYCLLVEETTGTPPPYGILRYAEQSWEIPWDARRRTALLALLDEIDAAEGGAAPDRSHDQPARCRGCSQRPHCTQSLV